MSYNTDYIEGHGQYIKSISFSVPNAPYIFSIATSAPAVDVKCNVDAVKVGENNAYEVTIEISVEAKMDVDQQQKKVAFVCDLKFAGLFSTPSTTEEEIRRLMLVDAAFLLFPFARARLADTVMSAGFPPLVLSPINFASKYNEETSN